jgi:hypothetical protein
MSSTADAGQSDFYQFQFEAAQDAEECYPQGRSSYLTAFL